ncbi:MotA/TolQ/ExbB proton channel family protein [bacterium]|nr:MotA/TolQ/ExbB proton channel family protein [bacterium]
MLDFIRDGGPFMWVILSTSFFAIAIMFEKIYSIFFYYKPKVTFFNDVLKHVRQKDLAAAKLLCSGTSHPLAKIIAVILNNYNKQKEAMESEIAKEVQKLVPKIQKHTSYLHMIGNVATLLGLIGTIQGLILSFSSLQGSGAANKSEMLASGISTAMNTTALGLVIAIPCIIAFTIFVNNETDIMQKYNEIITETVHVLEFETVEKEVIQ